jgi:hypothetical protein
MQGFPETSKLFQGFLQGKKIEKGCYILLQVNGTEKKSIALPRHQLDNLTHDDALELALSQTDLQKYISGYRIVSTAFTLHPSYEAVINIKTERISKEKLQHMQEG